MFKHVSTVIISYNNKMRTKNVNFVWTGRNTQRMTSHTNSPFSITTRHTVTKTWTIKLWLLFTRKIVQRVYTVCRGPSAVSALNMLRAGPIHVAVTRWYRSKPLQRELLIILQSPCTKIIKFGRSATHVHMYFKYMCMYYRNQVWILKCVGFSCYWTPPWATGATCKTTWS